MRWLRNQPLINFAQTRLFTNHYAYFSSYSYNNSIQDNYHHHLLSLLNTFPSSRRITHQIHSKFLTNGSLIQCPNAPIIFVYNTLLRRYALGEFPQEAMYLHKQATPALSSRFDSFTYSFLVKACANMNQSFLGFQFHGIVVKLGFERHVYVQTALLNMYVDFGFLSEAEKVFDEMPERNLVTWNVMVTGLVRWGRLEEALALFRNMPSRNVVSWTSMIDGLARIKDYQGAYTVFREMTVRDGIMPTEVSLLAISTAIADLGDIKNCQLVHAYSEKCVFTGSFVQVANSLIDTYAKCGCIGSALRVFEGVSNNRRNLVTWTSLVAGFAMHGMAKEAAQGFENMKSSGIRANRVTSLSVLNAYSHSGLVEEGLQFFEKMVGEGFVAPDIKNYGSVVDMLGRAGKLKEAEDIASQIPDHIDSVVIWRTILGACSVHGYAEAAERVTRKIQELERGYGGDYVLMSNILTDGGKFSEAEKVRTLMDERSVPKVSGHSSV